MVRDNDPDSIPSIVPSRDDDVPAAASRSGGARRERGATPGARAAAPAPRGAGVLTRLFLTVALVVAAVACAWAWQLEEKLTQASFALERYEERIADLEARLSDTDQGLTDNAATMSVKIKELYSEVDKLWASAWRRNKAAIAELEGKSVNQGEQLAALEQTLGTATTQLRSANEEIAQLKAVAGDLERLLSTARAGQAERERMADTLNRINLDVVRLSQRVESTEGWLESVNAFRSQVNSRLSQFEATLRSLQQGG